MRPDTATPNWSRWTLKSQEPLRMWQMSSRPRAGTTQSSISFTKSCRQTYPQGEHQSQSWQNTREVLGALEDLGVGQGSAEDRVALINRCVGVAHIRHLNRDTPEPQMQDITATHSTSKQTLPNYVSPRQETSCHKPSWQQRGGWWHSFPPCKCCQPQKLMLPVSFMVPTLTDNQNQVQQPPLSSGLASLYPWLQGCAASHPKASAKSLPLSTNPSGSQAPR